MIPESFAPVVILGCGYTGERVARRFLKRGFRVIGTSRHPDRLHEIEGLEPRYLDVTNHFLLDFVPHGALVLHSIPPIENDDPAAIPHALGERPRRVVYLSTTGVYGDQRDVNADTPASPRTPRDRQRLAAETAISRAPGLPQSCAPPQSMAPDVAFTPVWPTADSALSMMAGISCLASMWTISPLTPKRRSYTPSPELGPSPTIILAGSAKSRNTAPNYFRRPCPKASPPIRSITPAARIAGSTAARSGNGLESA